jgi:sulfonate transport system substrate-binding protein
VVDILHKETGISKDSLRLAVDRYSYGATRITPRIGKAQQTIADVFYELNLIPREINVESVLWPEPASVALNAQ